jgi:hypothetical protein
MKSGGRAAWRRRRIADECGIPLADLKACCGWRLRWRLRWQLLRTNALNTHSDTTLLP